MAKAPGIPVRSALAAAVFALLPTAAGAAQVNYEVGVGVLQSDNIGLASGNGQDETVVMPQLRFDLLQTGSRLSLNGSGQLQYLDYQDNTFDDDFRGAFSGQALWTLLPERLEWTFEDYLSRQPVDNLAVFSPDNQQQTNLFVTGPTLYLRLGSGTRAQFDLRYSNSYAEETDAFDSDRYNAAARLVRDLATNRTLSANIEATRVKYDDAPIDVDYTRYDGYATYSSRLRTVDFSIDLGYSRLEFEHRAGDEWLPLVRGTLAWRPTARSTLDVAAGYEFSDAAEDMVTSVIGGGQVVIDTPGSPLVPITPEVFKQRRLEAGYEYAGERLGLQVRPFYQRVSYVDSLARDEESWGGYASVSWKLRPRLTLAASAATLDRSFDQLSRRDRDSSVGVSLENQFTRNWSARIDLQRRERDSSEPGQDYQENVAIVSFAYRR
ncbi:MAG TPA: outer membrane beta-barrel protein [Luteimonas sp.]|nr:outer membrane beta-barrel protein [Luteimonas sp.]